MGWLREEVRIVAESWFLTPRMFDINIRDTAMCSRVINFGNRYTFVSSNETLPDRSSGYSNADHNGKNKACTRQTQWA